MGSVLAVIVGFVGTVVWLAIVVPEVRTYLAGLIKGKP